MSGPVTLAKLEEALPPLPEGHWLAISEDGTVKWYGSDDEVHAEFDLDAIEEPAPVQPPPDPVRDEEAFNAAVAQRVQTILGGIIPSAPDRTTAPRQYVAGRFGGLTAQNARVLGVVAWLQRTTSPDGVLSSAVAKAVPGMPVASIGTSLWNLRRDGLVSSRPITPGAHARIWSLSEKGRDIADQIGDEPFHLAQMTPPWELATGAK